MTLMNMLDRIRVFKGNLREEERDDVLKKVKVVKKGSVSKLKMKEHLNKKRYRINSCDSWTGDSKKGGIAGLKFLKQLR